MGTESEIRHRVVTALRSVPDLSRIGAAVHHEIVTLAGSVGSLIGKDTAGAIASEVYGVRAVINEIEVEDFSPAPDLARHILVPIDLSEERVGPLRTAHFLAKHFGSRITVFYVDPIASRPEQEPIYTERLRRTIELYAGPELEPMPFEIAIGSGDPAGAILRQADVGGNDLIVMGTTARETAHPAGHSVSAAVVRAASCPVLSIGEHDYPPVQRGVGTSAIVCAVNRTALARDATLVAAKLAAACGAHLILVRVLEADASVAPATEEKRLRRWLDEEVWRLHPPPVDPYRLVVVRGDPSKALLECACHHDSQLLVIGAQQKKQGDVTTIGTTTGEIMRSASTPLLVVPQRSEG